MRTSAYVKADQVQAVIASDAPRQDPVVGGLDEFVDQLGGGEVANPAALFAQRPRSGTSFR
jgi:hypothetical protein